MSASHPPPPPLPEETPPPVGHRVLQFEHPTEKTALALTRVLLSARKLELRIAELYRQGTITGGCYSGIGNEATSVGSAWALARDDVLVPTHRDLGSHLVRGHDALEVLRQYLKRGTSQTGGKDAGLHLGKEGSNIVGMISHLAHMLPVAVGIALAERQRGRETVVLTTVGDGSTSLGDFHESLNFAAIHRLPVVFLIVNNQYAYSTPVTLQYACARLADRAQGYGMKGVQVDGTDLIEVVSKTREAVARAREGKGPTLIESRTMRMRGHSEHDDFRYVPQTLLERWAVWDPLTRWLEYVTANGLVDGSTLDALDGEVGRAIDDALRVAKAEPAPRSETAKEDVYRQWAPAWDVPQGSESGFEP